MGSTYHKIWEMPTMNALDRWRSEQGWTCQRLADELGCIHATASRYCLGRRIPEPSAMARIHALTKGAVTANDFYGLPEPRPVLVALARPDRRGAFERLGWQPWPDPEAAPCGLMCRKARPGEDWQAVVAELAYLTGPAQPAAPPDAGAPVASGVDPN